MAEALTDAPALAGAPPPPPAAPPAAQKPAAATEAAPSPGDRAKTITELSLPENTLKKEAKAAEEAKAHLEAGGEDPALTMPSNTLKEAGAESWQTAGLGAPEKYEPLKIPASHTEDGKEGTTQEAGKNPLHDQILAESKELGLSQEQAQKHFERCLNFADAVFTNERKLMAAQTREYAKELEAANLHTPEVARDARVALAKIDPNGRLEKLLDDFGLYAMPEIVRGLANYGKTLGEANAITQNDKPGGTGQIGTANESRENLLQRLVDFGVASGSNRG